MNKRLEQELAKPVEPSHDALFRFGKYAGMTVDQVPADYLLWCVRNLDDKFFNLIRVIEAEILVRCKETRTQKPEE